MVIADAHRLAVVIPCYRVADHLAGVLSAIGPQVDRIYCVIDASPDESERIAHTAKLADSRIEVISLPVNQGVGGAFCAGLQRALADGCDVVVKLDGDGQMDPRDIDALVTPLVHGEADYAKGNRFFHLEHLQAMPWIRLIGNSGLSFLSKLSSGYWNLLDPTNGFIAIHRTAAEQIDWNKVARRWFFESDMLFRLSIIRAVVVDVPLPARYANEKSNLPIMQTLLQFPLKHKLNFLKRIFYCYFLREFHIASFNLLLGLALITFGVAFGLFHWIEGYQLNQLASAGTVMFAALPIILGWQALLSFLSFDVGNVPKRPLQLRILRRGATIPESR